MFDKTKVPKVSVFRAKDMGKRVWGQELLVGLMPGEYAKDGVSMKLIQMNAGYCGRFQMHFRRHEYGYILEGALRLRVGLADGTVKEYVLGPGDAYHFPAGLPHQEEAITDMKVLELSPGLGNDRLGLEKEYGLPAPVEGALPDSSLEEITVLEPWWKEGEISDGR
jgi:mannose-6-phosphate isomerase-like protein (cupin superfamily)